MTEKLSRRTVVRAAGAGIAATTTALAGCSSGGSGEGPSGNTVFVAPDGKFVFEPEKLTVKKGDTVTWEFKSGGHNVYAYPDGHDTVSIPDGAAAFGSVPKGDKYTTNSEGETFTHTFETAGTYTYVCVPHAGQGMVGKVIVE